MRHTIFYFTVLLLSLLAVACGGDKNVSTSSKGDISLNVDVLTLSSAAQQAEVVVTADAE